MRKVLITGGAGFIGRHLAAAHRAVGDEVVVLDSLLPQVHGAEPPVLPAGTALHVGDVTDREALAAAAVGCELCYHLAAETGTGQSMYEPTAYVTTNVTGTAVLLEVLAELAGAQELAGAKGPARIVLAASRAVYGEGAARCAHCELVHPAPRTPADLAAARWEPRCPRCSEPTQAEPTAETAPVRPASIYGVTKYAQEELLRVAAEAGQVDVWALRFQNVYGPGQALANPYTGLLAVFLNRLRGGSACELYEDGECARDFIYVADVVDALLRAGARPAEGFRVVNVGSGRATTVREVAAELGEILGGAPEARVSGRYRVGDIRHGSADIACARRELGWEPRTGLRAGLQSFVTWAGDQPVVADRSEEALAELRGRGLGGQAGVVART